MIVRPRITALASYTFFALEALADELQDPFGVEPNDLPLEAITWTIEATLRQMIDERVISNEPVAVQPVLTRVSFRKRAQADGAGYSKRLKPARPARDSVRLRSVNPGFARATLIDG